MKYILTIAFAFIVSASVAQSKKYYHVEYTYTTDCGSDRGSQWADFPINYEQSRASLKKWVGKHGLKSFHIYAYERISKAEYLRRGKGTKFTCTDPLSFIIGGSVTRTSDSSLTPFNSTKGLIYQKDTTIKISIP